MGEIINVDFGGSKKEEPTDSVAPMEQKMESQVAVLKKVGEIKSFLSTVPFNLETYSTHQQEVYAMSYKERSSRIESSTLTDWQTHPMYFKALTDTWNMENVSDILRGMVSGLNPEEDDK